MSPSADRPATARWSRRAVLVAGLVIGAGVPLSARAALPDKVVAPGELGEPDTLPTETLVDNAYPLLPVDEDRQHVARRTVTPTGTDWRLDANVAFAKDSDVLRPAATARLAQVAVSLAAAPPSTVAITGYTDDLGSAAHGLDLSRRRARAVRTALGDSLSRHQVRVVGRGEADPLVPNDSEAHRAVNRRVEIHVTHG